MNKTDRMLAIILELQGKGMQRAEDLAATFETSVRTIYRDMQALSEAGVPIIGSPGQGYSLSEGYFLPPVSLTSEEAVTLLLGLEFIDQQFDEQYQAKAREARSKIEAVLSDKVRKEADRTRAGVRLQAANPDQALLSGTMAVLRAAVRQSRQVRFGYAKMSENGKADELVTRTVNPYGLLFRNGMWMLVAYCHLRQSIRHFLLRRMQAIELLDETFTPPADFDLRTYTTGDDRHLTVRLEIESRLVTRIKEYNFYYMEAMEELGDGGAIATLRVRRLEDIMPWVLGLGSGVTVLEPDALRMRIKREAEKMLERY